MAEPVLPKVCAFDFDGTVVDTMWGYARIAADAMQRFHEIPFTEGHQLYLDTSGIPFFQQLEIIRPGSSDNRACAEEFESRKIEGLFESAPEEVTLQGLALLRNAGIKVAVSSNNFQHLVDEYLARYSRLRFDLALGFDEVHGLEKGTPHFIEIERIFGVQTSQVLYCGDSIKDGERATAHGVAFVGMTGIFTRQQFIDRFPGLATVDNLLEFAKRVLSGNIDFGINKV